MVIYLACAISVLRRGTREIKPMTEIEVKSCPICGESYIIFFDGRSHHKCPPRYQVRFTDCPGEWSEIYAKSALIAAEDFIAKNDDLSYGEIANDILVIVRDKNGSEITARVYGDIIPSYWAEVDESL